LLFSLFFLNLKKKNIKMIKTVGKTKYIFELGKIEEKKVDLIYLWTTPSLNSGDLTFIRVHKEAGSQLSEQCLSATINHGIKDSNQQYVIPAGQCVITDAGNLEQYNIIHCVLPNHKDKQQNKNKLIYLTNVIQNGIELAKAYGELEYDLKKVAFYPISTPIYGEVNEKDLKEFFKIITSNNYFKKVYFVFESEEEKEVYEKVFFKLNSSFLEKVINYFHKFEF